MLVGHCYCKRVEVRVPRKPRTLTDCNCSVCRTYGALWAYYRTDQVEIRRKKGASLIATLGNGGPLRLLLCSRCGTLTHYDWGPRPKPEWRMAVNARIFDLEILESTPVIRLDGARNWKTRRTGPASPFGASRKKASR